MELATLNETLTQSDAFGPALKNATTLFGNEICYALSDASTISKIEDLIMNEGLYIINGVYLLLGLFILLCGVKVVRPITIFAGFVAGTVFGLYLYQILQTIDSDLQLSCIGLLGSVIPIGLLVALLVYLFIKIAYPIMAAALGVGVGYLVYSLGFNAIQTPQFFGQPVLYWVFILVPMIASIALFLKYKKHVIWVASSFGGAFLVTFAIYGLTTMNTYKFPNYSQYQVMAVVVGIVAILTLIGLVFQYRVFINPPPTCRQENRMRKYRTVDYV